MDNKSRAGVLRQEHAVWREKNFNDKAGFFPVFYGFKDYLPILSSGAISLFLYLGLHSNNKTGECYHDVSTMAEFFNKSPRTISTWISELEKCGLIERMQLIFNGVAHTFIRPYGGEGIKNGQVKSNSDD